MLLLIKKEKEKEKIAMVDRIRRENKTSRDLFA
jgi:hypothetical protein